MPTINKSSMIELTINKSFPLTNKHDFIDVVVSVSKQWGVYVESDSMVVPFDTPVVFEFDFYCRCMCDPPNVIASDGHKWVLKAMVASGMLYDLYWKNVAGFIDTFHVDSNNPRVVVRVK